MNSRLRKNICLNITSLVLSEVASFYGLSVKQIYKHKGHAIRICWPRQVAMTLALENGATLSEAVKHVGLSTHSSAVYARRVVKNICSAYPGVSDEVREIRLAVSGRIQSESDKIKRK